MIYRFLRQGYSIIAVLSISLLNSIDYYIIASDQPGYSITLSLYLLHLESDKQCLSGFLWLLNYMSVPVIYQNLIQNPSPVLAYRHTVVFILLYTPSLYAHSITMCIIQCAKSSLYIQHQFQFMTGSAKYEYHCEPTNSLKSNGHYVAIPLVSVHPIITKSIVWCTCMALQIIKIYSCKCSMLEVVNSLSLELPIMAYT